MSLRARTLLNAALVLLIAFFAFARLVPEPVRRASALLPDQGLRLGLDLRGGIHWVLGVKLERAVAQELEYLRGSLGEQLSEEKVAGVEVSVDAGRLLVRAADPSDLSRAAELVAESDVLRELERSEALVAFGLTEGWEKEVRERAMQQVLEVLRTRIEDPAKGIAESVVTRQGTDRVLVQIPGGDLDREAARSLLEVTGFLEFKIVRDQAPSEELLRAKHPNGLPPGSVIAFERERQTRRPIMAYLVDEQPAITGQYLADARVRFDNRQRPIVSFRWTPEGGEIFGTLTEENKGRLLAIILDGEVKSAPVIKDRISMSGQIEGRFTTQEASDLAIVLRAGSLSVPVVIEEERTVGPALGADSIRRGVLAGLVGSAAIFAFVIVYYRVSGVFASVTLLLNVVMVIGLMSLPEMPGTLTLPGIAGLVLTVGMAVDANVIVFERIREELRAGKVAHAAVDTGFNKALWTILDANITTLLTALVLYEFGTGPIKGFAVTLSIGLVSNVYAAVVLSRLLFDWYLRGERRLAPLSI